ARVTRLSPSLSSSEPRALTGLAAGHVVRRALRVADLRGRIVARAIQVAVDDVGDDLVPVGIRHRVAIEVDRAVDGVADEPVPEAVVADLGVAAVDHAVLDRVPRDVERPTERARPAVQV